MVRLILIAVFAAACGGAPTRPTQPPPQQPTAPKPEPAPPTAAVPVAP